MDVLAEICLRMDPEDVKSFKSTTYEIQYFIEEVEKDEEYWRRKLSRYLGFEVSQRNEGESWRKMYENVVKAKKDPYKIIELNYVEILAGLIKEGFDPSARDNYAIQSTSKNGHLVVVKLLLQDPRVDLSADNNYAIRLASEHGHLEVVKLLLQDPRVDPSADDNYAIRGASDNGHLEVVKLLLQDPRVRNSLSGEELTKYQKQTK